jgi:DNA-binding response OmpR family regulator
MLQGKPFIVIAEDDKAYGKVYVNKLTSEGYEVTLVNNGADVVPTLLQRKPALLLLDLIMPKKDGFAVLEEIRSIAGLQDLRVIVASNLSQDIDKEKVAKYNVYDYFVKSDISISELLAKVKSAAVAQA